MGHERVGFLPKTKRWNELVKQIGNSSSSDLPIESIAAQTLNNVRKQYETLFHDESVKSVFAFLVAFSRACHFSNPQKYLREYGIELSDQPTLLSVIKSLRAYAVPGKTNSEYGQLALFAAADAAGQWFKEHKSSQLPLFGPSPDFFESWRDLGTGGGFCELARLYFGKLTERYLNYFLDRTASATLSNVQRRDHFQNQIQKYVEDVSKHAFETAKITQSFAAGWFAKHTREGLPDLKAIEGFLAIAFGKLRDELRREAEAK